ncbi:MAG: hypothetical protein N2169_06515 [bacterium]|nr:hypothetical protein [bacterium]
MGNVLKLSKEERDAIDMISSLLDIDEKQVQVVFLSLLVYMFFNVYDSNKEFVIIPYFGKINLTVKNSLFMDSTTSFVYSNSLKYLLSKKSNNENDWIEEFLCKVLFDKLLNKVVSYNDK